MTPHSTIDRPWKQRARRWRTSTLAACLLVSFAVGHQEASSDGSGWKRVAEEDGITVTARLVDGMKLPTFRGEGAIEGNLLDILAVLNDNTKHTTWMQNCVESAVLERFSEIDSLVYNRTDAPWPVSDRDVVLRSLTRFDLDNREVVAAFESTNSDLRPVVDDVVRIPSLAGFYRLNYVSDSQTHVVYQVTADPGGNLPLWLAELATRELPLSTLQQLRGQVGATRGQYDDVLARWVQMFNLPVDLMNRKSRPWTRPKIGVGAGPPSQL